MCAREIHEGREVLDSWKEISVHLGRDVRTCRRWEERYGLPVHRLDGSPKARVRAYKDEIDRWLEKRLHEREPVRRPLDRLRSWPFLAGLVAFLAVLVIGAAALLRTGNGRPRYVPGPDRPALAVMPFVNGTGDEGLDYLREYFPGQVIRDLQKSSDHLLVFSLETVVEAVRGLDFEPGEPMTSDDIEAVASRIEGDWLLTGYISKSGSRLQVDYELRDVASLAGPSGAPAGAPIKSDSVRGTEAEVLDAADRVASGVRRAFGVPAAVAPEAFLGCTLPMTRFYEMARSVERKYLLTLDPADLAKMIEYLEKARLADPECPLVYLGLGDAYQHKYVYEMSDPEALRLLKENYARAFAMAPERAEANCGAGWVFFLEGDNDRAYGCFKKALTVDPASLYTLLEVGSFLRSIGLLERASDYYSRVIRAGGATADIHFLRGWTYEHMGFYESALADYDRMVKLEPLEWRSRCLRARVLVLMRRYEAAASELATAESMAPREPGVALIKALLAAATGDRAEALAAIAPERLGTRARHTVYKSRIFSKLGLADEAIAQVELGIAKGFGEVYEYLFSFPLLNNRRDHFFENLRADPRFAEILRRQELKYVENLGKYSGL